MNQNQTRMFEIVGKLRRITTEQDLKGLQGRLLLVLIKSLVSSVHAGKTQSHSGPQ